MLNYSVAELRYTSFLILLYIKMVLEYDICIILDDIASVFARLSVLLCRNINITQNT